MLERQRRLLANMVLKYGYFITDVRWTNDNKNLANYYRVNTGVSFTTEALSPGRKVNIRGVTYILYIDDSGTEHSIYLYDLVTKLWRELSVANPD